MASGWYHRQYRHRIYICTCEVTIPFMLLRKLTYSAYRLFLKLSSLINFSHALNVLKVGQKGKDNT